MSAQAAGGRAAVVARSVATVPAATLLGLVMLAGCADRATIGALCPAGCEPRPAQGICECSPEVSARDAGSCTAPACAPEAGLGSDPPAADGGVDACAQVARRALDLVVVFDDSASLAPWYVPVYEGFRAFLRDEASQGLGVGLLRFGDSCAALDYLPPLVPIAPLPDNLSAIDAVLPLTALSTNSTLPALDAAEQLARRWALDHPESRVSVLLITDASPGGCDGLSGNYDMEAARLAEAARSGQPAIDTYVVAPGSFELVDNIARSGGTQLQRLPITATSDDMLAALRAVRERARSCELVLPSQAAPSVGSQVVVDGRAFEIGEDSAACDDVGFYLAGAQLVACPETCALLEGAQLIALPGACDPAGP